jgi:hypothetical protein
LESAPDNRQSGRVGPGEKIGGITARRAGTNLAQVIGFELSEGVRGFGVE